MPPPAVKVPSATRRSICQTWPGAYSGLLLDLQGRVAARGGIRDAAPYGTRSSPESSPSSGRADALGERLRLRRDRWVCSCENPPGEGHRRTV